uniref:Putative ovule protein n=1 Tax=Solanum chacoense TaxID=4108 RepID=A0A0V0GMY1_SOLCH
MAEVGAGELLGCFSYVGPTLLEFVLRRRWWGPLGLMMMWHSCCRSARRTNHCSVILESYRNVRWFFDV